MNVGYIAHAHLPTSRCVKQQILNAAEVGARGRRAIHVDVVGLALAEDVADFLAMKQRRGRAAHIARLEAIALCFLELHFDLDLWDLLLKLHVQVDNALHAGERLLDLARFGADALQIRTVDSNDQGVAFAREHLIDPLVEIGQDVVEHAGIAVDNLPNGSHRGVIINSGLDADPTLAEIDAADLVCQ